MKLWPTRTKALDVDPVTDLDQIVAEPVPFRFKGKIHYLKPIEFGAFMKFTNAHARMMEFLRDDGPVTARDLAKKYLDVITPVCDTINLEDILSMEQAQIAALFQLVIDKVTGQINSGDGKKKRKKIDLYESVEPSSSQNAPENLDGQPERH